MFKNKYWNNYLQYNVNYLKIIFVGDMYVYIYNYIINICELKMYNY